MNSSITYLYKTVKGLVFIVSVGLAVFCCKSKKEGDLQSLRVCTEIRLDSTGREVDFQPGLRPEAVAPKESLWPHVTSGQIIIAVKFLNGTEFQKQKVMQYARRWTEISKKKIRFLFTPYDGTSTTYDVRITFYPGGSQSVVGSFCKLVPQNQATMNFGWINESTPEIEIQQVVLHEFGHVVGLGHEHQSPAANIPWDKPKVYDYYRRTQNPPWDQAKVDANIFAKYDISQTNYSAYDKVSIMHYATPKELTINQSYETPWNSDLSPTDIAFIQQQYPYRPCTVNVDCCFDRRGRRVPCP